MAGKGKNKFAEAAYAARKGKVATGTSATPLKRARRVEEIIVLSPPPPPPATTIGPPNIQLKSSSRGNTPPLPSRAYLEYEEAGTGAPWRRSI